MAKFSMVPGTYAAGDSIPLISTIRGGPIYHEDGSPVIQVKGSGCPYRPAQYDIGMGATLTSIGATAEQLALMQDGVRVPGGLISIDAAAAGEVSTASVPNEVSTVTSSRLAVEAVTALTITDGVVVIHKV